MKLRHMRKKEFRMPEVTLTPLIDTALTLLVIFMVTAPMVQNGIKLDLPHGKSKETGAVQELVVSVSNDGAVYFNSYQVKSQELVSSVQQALQGKEDEPVFVRADKAVEYGKVMEVVDELKQAGVKYVAMSMQPPK